MNKNRKSFTEFSREDIQQLEPSMKIGILGTVSPDGLPHLTFISTLKACSPKQLSFGQFMEGRSKIHLRQNPKAGWLIMTLDRNLWRGKAIFASTAKDGKDFDFYNNTPLFRYNAYFGIHTVYYLDLIEHIGMAPLPMNQIIKAAVKTMLARNLSPRKNSQVVLNPWVMAFLNKLNTLKFLAYIGKDGHPLIIPAIQTQAAGPEHVIFSASVYSDELEAIPEDQPLAVFALSLDMEDVLLRGTFQGLQRIGGVRSGLVKINWVYNSMPPVPGQVFPEIPVQAVRDFQTANRS